MGMDIDIYAKFGNDVRNIYIRKSDLICDFFAPYDGAYNYEDEINEEQAIEFINSVNDVMLRATALDKPIKGGGEYDYPYKYLKAYFANHPAFL